MSPPWSTARPDWLERDAAGVLRVVEHSSVELVMMLSVRTRPARPVRSEPVDSTHPDTPGTMAVVLHEHDVTPWNS